VASEEGDGTRFKAFFIGSGALAYEAADLQGIFDEHRAVAGSRGPALERTCPHTQSPRDADVTVFDVGDLDREFDIYALDTLPLGVEHVGHFHIVS
jgi:hypothetical protein